MKYKDVREGEGRFQEVRDSDRTLIRRQELPQGMTIGKISLEASVRHMLGDLADA